MNCLARICPHGAGPLLERGAGSGRAAGAAVLGPGRGAAPGGGGHQAGGGRGQRHSHAGHHTLVITRTLLTYVSIVMMMGFYESQWEMSSLYNNLLSTKNRSKMQVGSILTIYVSFKNLLFINGFSFYDF